MDFDFLVFPSPKCSYNKTKLGNELIFIPKYLNFPLSAQEKPDAKTRVSSKQSCIPSVSQVSSMASPCKLLKKCEAMGSSQTTLPSDLQSPRKINVKLEMNYFLGPIKNTHEDEQPITPQLENSEGKNLFEKKLPGKMPINLQEMAINEQKKSFFLKNNNDFDEEVDKNLLSSPKKILDYRFKEPQKANPFYFNSPTKSFTSRNKARPNYFTSNPTSLKTQFASSNQNETKEKVDRYIPCLFLETENCTDKILIYFHGNAEDIYLAHELLDYIQRYLRVKVLAIEYPGYGVYTSHKPSSEIIEEDALVVYDYLTKKVGYCEKNILLLGRSIGSGPASYLARHRNPGALIMMSSFTSLKMVVKDHVGSLHKILKERFNNYENVKKVKCPSFFIHGLRDKLISYIHSQKLHDVCGGPSELCLPKEMTHSEFCFDSDFIFPLEAFLRNFGFDFFGEREEKEGKLKFPEEVYTKQSK